jgi:FKBP-type peptidyl-prolyl cis-trans isomerase
VTRHISTGLICLWCVAVLPAGRATAAQQESILAAPADLKAPPADAAKSASGLVSTVLTPATGTDRPGPTDIVTVHYTGWSAADGSMYDSSMTRDKPAMFPLDRAALPGWRECVRLMVVGEKRRCWLPEELAYGGAAKRPAGMMVFDIELLDTRPSPLVPPENVAMPPADARRTSTGLAYKVLRPGTGVRSPRRGDRVLVHYSGWTTNGKLFDSSISRGEPLELGLDEVIPGWSEGLQLMVTGERTRLWIPQDLAYKGQQGAPRGMLVFDVELVEIR